jgi:hypothetical protein
VSISQDAAMVATGNYTAATAFSLGTPPTVVIEDTTAAIESPGNPVHSCTKSADFKNVWFSVRTPNAGRTAAMFYDLQPNGGDAGMVFTLYTLQNGRVGSEFGCFVYPQSDDPSSGGTVTWTAAAGSTYLIEVSATTSGAAAGSIVLGGNLQMWFTQGK